MQRAAISLRQQWTLILIFAMIMCIFSAAQVSPRPPATQAAPPAYVPDIPPELSSAYMRLNGTLPPQVRAWIAEQARIQQQKTMPDSAALEAAIRSRFGNTVNPLEALFLLFMEAVKQNNEDKKYALGKLNSLNERKGKLHELVTRVDGELAAHTGAPKTQPCRSETCLGLGREVNLLSSQSGSRVRTPVPGQLTYETLAQVQQQLKNELRQLNDTGELEKLELQKSIDRRSRLLAETSNILKKADTTSQGIVRNVK